MVHAEELSRAISDLHLSNLASGAAEAKNFGRRYTEHEQGMKTPPDPPAVPPPTPERLPPTPEDLQHQEPDAVEPLPSAAEDPKVTNKKKKASGKKKAAPPTGFEGGCSPPDMLTIFNAELNLLEFYADPPVTPDEHEEESEIYSP